MKDKYLPGLESLKHKLTEEEEKCKFYEILFVKMNNAERLEIFWPHESGYEKDDKKELTQISGYAEKYDLELPTSIKRELKQWTGKDRHKQLMKSQGSKYAMNLIDHIQRVIPLSIKGLDCSFDDHSLKWKRESDGKEFTFYLPIDKQNIMKPATGDLAKRVVLNVFRFAIARRTHDPGPITFEEFLDNLGEKNASQSTRQRIMDICKSCAFTSMTITKKNEKGQEIYFDHTPFFKRFIWKGKLDHKAIIYPIINEQFEKMLIEENLNGYIWFADERLKRLPKGMDARDRIAQDQFKAIQGFPVIRFIMRNWLYKFGQFTDTEILKRGLTEIKEFVNKNVALAKESKLIERVKIQRFQKKESYLNQVIWIYPIKPTWPKKEKIKLTTAEQGEVKDIIDWLYEIGVEDYADIARETIKEYLENIAKHGYLDCLRAARETVEDYADPDYPVDEKGGYQNRPMEFWLEYKNCMNKNRLKK